MSSRQLILCGVLLFLGWWALHLEWIGIALFILVTAYVIGGYESAREGLTTLIQEKELNVDLLMIVAALGAAGLGLWRQEYFLIIDGAVLILIFAISGALEGYAMRHTDRATHQDAIIYFAGHGFRVTNSMTDEAEGYTLSGNSLYLLKDWKRQVSNELSSC